MDWHIHLFIHPSSCPLLNIYHEPDPVLCAGDLATKNTDLSPACGLKGGGGRKNIKQLHKQLYHYDGDIPQEGLLTPRHMCSTLSIVAKKVIQELTGNSIRIRKEILTLCNTCTDSISSVTFVSLLGATNLTSLSLRPPQSLCSTWSPFPTSWVLPYPHFHPQDPKILLEGGRVKWTKHPLYQLRRETPK